MTKVLKSYGDEMSVPFLQRTLPKYYQNISRSSIVDFRDFFVGKCKESEKIGLSVGSVYGELFEEVMERLNTLAEKELPKNFAIKAVQDITKQISALSKPNLKPLVIETLPEELERRLEKTEIRFCSAFERITHISKNGNFHGDLPRNDLNKTSAALKLLFGNVACLRNEIGKLFDGIAQVHSSSEIASRVKVEGEENSVDCKELLNSLETLIFHLELTLLKTAAKLTSKNDLLGKLSEIKANLIEMQVFTRISLFKGEINIVVQLISNIDVHVNSIMKSDLSCIEKNFVNSQLSSFPAKLGFLMKSFETLEFIESKNSLFESLPNSFLKKLNKRSKKYEERRNQDDIPTLALDCEFATKLTISCNELWSSLCAFPIDPSIVLLANSFEKSISISFDSLLAEYEKAVKLLYLLSNICSNLFYNGFCMKDSTPEGEQGADQMVDGTGIGSGKGEENKTGEMEFEEQVLGTKGEEDQNSELLSEPSSNSEQMDADFEDEQGQGSDKEQGQGGDQEEGSFEEQMSSVDDEEGKEKEGDKDSDEAEEDAEGDLKAEKGEGELADNERDLRKDEQRNVEEGEEAGSEGEDQNESGMEEEKDEQGMQEEQDFEIGDEFDDKDEIEEEEQNEPQLEEEGDLNENSGESELNEENEGIDEEEEKKEEDGNGEENGSVEGEEEFEDEQDLQPRIENLEISQPNEEIFGKEDAGDNANQNTGGGSESKPSQNKESSSNSAMTRLEQQIIQEMRSQPQLLKNFQKNLSVLNDSSAKELPSEDKSKNNEMHKLAEDDNEDDPMTNLPGISNENNNEKMELEEEKKENEEENQHGPSKANPDLSAETGGGDTNDNKDEEKVEEGEETKMEIEEVLETQSSFLPISKPLPAKTSNIPSQDDSNFLPSPKQIEDLLSVIGGRNVEEGLVKWKEIEAETRHGARVIEEHLKAVLEPTEAAAYKGDFKTGKRLNMKKLIPYIASNYRKDRIWLRRADPSKQQHQILLGLDNSLSMKDKNVGFAALKALLSLQMALGSLEAGDIAIAAMADGLELIQDFGGPLNSSSLPGVLSKFDFAYSDLHSADTVFLDFNFSHFQASSVTA